MEMVSRREHPFRFGLLLIGAMWGLSGFVCSPTGVAMTPGQQTSSASSERGRWITGSVIDVTSGGAIAGARIDLFKRIVDVRPDGIERLRSLSASIPLGATSTDDEGRFVFRLPSRTPARFLALSIRAEGYWGRWIALIGADAGPVQPIDVELVRVDLSRRELALWARRQERLKRLLYQQNPSFDQAVDVRTWFAPPPTPPLKRDMPLAQDHPTYPVPDDVYVVDLAGFTGFIDLDEFIAGVVSIEMGDGFPFEALKAQAVAARSFALERFHRTGVANGGQAYTPRIGSKSLTATINTSKVVMLYDEDVIVALFSARCNGDFTLNSEHGLSGTSTCIVGGLGVGRLPYARSRPCSGHINCSQTAERCCEVFVEGRLQYIHGHGVGLCQRGAQEFAGRDGWDWRDILTDYYTDIALANAPGLTIGVTVTTTANLNVRETPCGRRLTTVPRGTRGVVMNGPERPFCDLAAPYSFFTWWQVVYENGALGWSVEDYLRKTSVPDSLKE